MLAGIYYGAMYGGSTTSILVNIPGEAASVVTCLDGYPDGPSGEGRAGPGDFGLRLLHRRDPRIGGLIFLAPPLAISPSNSGPRNILP